VDSRVVAVGADGYAAVWPERPATQETTPFAVRRGFWDGLLVYDADGLAWTPETVELRSVGGPLRRLVATVRNPRTSADITYGEPRSYELGELRDVLRRALGQDDDVLTQFHEAEEIEGWLDAAASFAEVVEALERAETP
jgi:hypothetical protein